MKNMLSVLLCMTMCISFACCSSNQSKEETTEKEVVTESYNIFDLGSDPDGVRYEYSFMTVSDLLKAIRKSPDQYDGAYVKVIGTISGTSKDSLTDYTVSSDCKEKILLPSEDGLLEMHNLNKELEKSGSVIGIKISNDAQYAVCEMGDYVKFYGILHLDRDNIYIGQGSYELIATMEERIASVKTE